MWNKNFGLYTGIICLLSTIISAFTPLLFLFVMFWVVSMNIIGTMLLHYILPATTTYEELNGLYYYLTMLSIYLFLLFIFFLIIRYNNNNRISKISLVLFFVMHYFIGGIICSPISSLLPESPVEEPSILMFRITIIFASLFYPLYGYLFDLIIKGKRKKNCC